MLKAEEGGFFTEKALFFINYWVIIHSALVCSW